MNLWWINQHARPPIFVGGTRHFSLAKELSALQNQVMIINGTFDHLGPAVLPQENGSKYPIFHTYEGISFLSINLPHYKGNASLGRIKNMYSFYLKTIKTLSPHKSKYAKPDIIIGSTVHPWGAYAGYKLSQMYNVPFVYEVRDLWPLTLIEIGKLKKWNPLVLYFDMLDKIMSQKADLIITTTPLMKKYYIDRWKLPEEKFLWITNGTNINAFSNDFHNRKDLREPNVPLRIVYAGNLGQANGINEILDIIQQNKEKLKNFEFHFWGDGPFKESLLNYIEQNNLPCFIHRPVSKEKLFPILQSADALLFYLQPSVLYKYGISLNKLADYHAAGKPIIAIGECAQNPVVESGAGLVASSICDLPQVLLDFEKLSFDEKISMGKKGQKYAQNHYNWNKLSTKLYSKLKEIQNRL